jgi:uncharacterized ferritin-like protein (DUF455 family)
VSLTAAACAILRAAEPAEKCALAAGMAAAWANGELSQTGNAVPPARPARPARPALVAPRDVRKRRRHGRGRFALLHAIAHIELNAIDLAADMLARFAAGAPAAFCGDWVQVAAEEAKHFGLLAERLAALGGTYGDLPAHDGLWQAAEATADDVLARLAVVPMVLEARGLDVTPNMIADLERSGDEDSAAVLRLIYEEEIGHVAAGNRWFRHFCAARGLDADSHWRSLVTQRFKGELKPPFNTEARAQAGMQPALYSP